METAGSSETQVIFYIPTRRHRIRSHTGNVPDSYSEVFGSSPDWAILNFGMLHRLGRDHFLPDSFQFIIHQLSHYSIILSRSMSDSRRSFGLDMALLTILQHDWKLQVITEPSLISTLYKSPQHTLSLFQPAVSSPAVPW
jgi:hypothetical protein